MECMPPLWARFWDQYSAWNTVETGDINPFFETTVTVWLRYYAGWS